jgi:hypothetical protein
MKVTLQADWMPLKFNHLSNRSTNMGDREASRRKLLVDALTLGVITGINATGLMVPARALGSLPNRLPAGQSIYRLEGKVIVDGRLADINTRIEPGSSVQTGENSEVIFVVGSDAFILRGSSKVSLGAKGMLVQGMRVLTGAILGVFGKREASHEIVTSAATIGIRGTGIYVDAAPDKTYACTCYGHTQISAIADPSQVRDIVTTYHDKPVYILKSGSQDQLIVPAPVIDHSDSELNLIEALVGRKTPFKGAGYKYEN